MAITSKLPRTLTLKSRIEIDRLLKNGERRSGRYFTLVWELSDSFRYAILLSRKIGKAVTRNRIKRLFREAIRLNRKSLKTPVKIIFLVRTLTNEPGFEDINAEVAQSFELLSAQSH